jgi:hypothetical protein
MHNTIHTLFVFRLRCEATPGKANDDTSSYGDGEYPNLFRSASVTQCIAPLLRVGESGGTNRCVPFSAFESAYDLVGFGGVIHAVIDSVSGRRKHSRRGQGIRRGI